ncbi:MAG: TIGR00153 family protein [Gammaproteobacteria bacterium]|nr:TIGR00153 family protein [Gammaproteobacteria bacterium]
MVQDYIFRMFGSSPVRPLQQHMDKVHACVSKLGPLFEAQINGDFEAVKSLQQEVIAMEHEADVLKKQLRLHLPKSLFLSMSRRDLLDVLRMQDNIANKSKDIAGLIVGRNMRLPETMSERFLDFVKRCIDASAQAKKTVNELDELVETGFSGNEVELVEEMIRQLDDIEGDTDVIQIEIRNRLFKIESDLPPIDVMFLYQLIEWIGDIGDLSQRVGSRLQLMLAR